MDYQFIMEVIMKPPNKNQGQYIDLLCRALQLFYENDATALFDQPQETTKSESPRYGKIVNERAMVGCVYRYMWCMMQQQIFEIPEFDIDIEYDRMIKGESGYYEKEISYKCERVNCNRRSNCIKVIVGEIQKRENPSSPEGGLGAAVDVVRASVRPDIIVHNRNKSGQPNNGLVVEFKKEHNKFRAGDIMFDMARLCYFTCQSEYTRFHYKIGAMVVLRHEYADVGFVAGKELLLRCTVDAKGVKKVSGESIQDDLMYNAIYGQRRPLSKP